MVRSSCITSVNTAPQGGQIIEHSTGQHSTTMWSDHRAFHWSTQHHKVIRSSCIPSVNAAPQGGQIIEHFIGQHSTTRWSDHRAFHLLDYCAFHWLTHHHNVVRSSCIPSVNTVPQGGQIIVHSIGQHSTTRWSDQKFVRPQLLEA